MESVRISRSRALKFFREKLGHSVLHLNTIIVGLNAVGKGIATKPTDLSISWAPQDLLREENLARGFAIRSLIVTAYDALDHYLYDIAATPSPIESEETKLVLLREMEHTPSSLTLQSSDVNALSASLISSAGDQSKLRKNLKDFTERFCGKLKRPSIRRRLQCLYEYCQNLPANSTCPAMPHNTYYSAVELLLAWRNVLVHDPDKDQLGSDALIRLSNDADYYKKNHANIDINSLIERYKESTAPTLKDVSTLVSVLIRFVSSIDANLIAQCNIESFFRASVEHEASLNCIKLNNTKEKSIRLSLELASQHGFVRSDSPTKKKCFSGVTFDLKEDCLSERLKANRTQKR